MNRLKAVTLLIERHRDLAIHHGELAQKHLQLSKDYEAYRYELNKPGFKTKGWRRFAGQGRIEPYLIHSEDGSVKQSK